MIEVVSLDLEGTLVSLRFSEMVWNVGIPRLYSEHKRLSFEEAKRVVLRKYQKVGEEKREWYDIKFWFKKLDLNGNWRKLMETYKNELEVYPEVQEVLRDLSREYRLILLSNSAREFIEFELEVIGNPFEKIFSATSDFNMLKKSKEFYKRICEILGVKPSEMAHVGDHYKFDFLTPKSLGIYAFYLDRTRRSYEKWAVKDLMEFKDRIKMIEEET